MAIEIWKDVVGYEGHYQVSSLGRIKSVTRNVKMINRDCVIMVGLSVGKKFVTRKVHVLLAKAFIPNPENKRTVNHKNAIKTDNRLENLEWCTHSENAMHAERMGLIKNRLIGERVHTAKLTEKDVIEIRSIYQKNNKELAEKFNVHTSTIRNIKLGISWKHVVVIFLTMLPIISDGQVLLPAWVADSAIYEIRKGRACDSVRSAQAYELNKLGAELVATGAALKLSQKGNSQLDSLIVNARESSEILAKQFNQDRKALRKKVRIRNLIIGGQLILILIILL